MTLRRSLLVLACAGMPLGCGSRSALEWSEAGSDAGAPAVEPLGISCPQTSVQRGAPWPTPYRCPDGSMFVPVPALKQPRVRWATALPVQWNGAVLNDRALVAADGTVYVSAEKKLLAVDHDGAIRWSKDGGGWLAGIGADGALYAYTAAGLVAMSPDGTPRWTLPDVFQNRFSLGNGGTAYVALSPASAGLGCQYGTDVVTAIGPDGTRRWGVPVPCNQDISGTASAIGVGADGTAYVTSSASGLGLPPVGHVLAIAADGSTRWQNDDDGDGVEAPMVGADGTVYVVLPDPTRTRAYGHDGTVRWETPHAGQMAALPDGDVLLLDQNLYDFRANGSVRWSVDLAAVGLGAVGDPVVVNDAIYLTQGCAIHDKNCRTRIVALSMEGVIMWTFDQLTVASWPVVGQDALYVFEFDLATWTESLVAISD